MSKVSQTSWLMTAEFQIRSPTKQHPSTTLFILQLSSETRLPPYMSTTTRRTQTRSTPRAHMSRRRPRSRSPDPIIARPSTLSAELGGGLAPSSATLQNALSKRSKRRENQNPTNSSSIHNSSRGNQNEVDTNSVSRGDKSKAKSL